MVTNVLRHAVIAGTGRAGTSFLVRYLSECGVDAGDLSQLGFFEEAQAGLECSIFADDPPYLIKDPWFFEYLDKVDETGFEIEALIIPIRDVREAAASRVLQERTALSQHFSNWPMRTTSGGVPGGSIYSLSIEDQARILAVGQAKLLSWATNRGIQPYLLGFPRMVDDAEYLYEALSPWITKFVDKDSAGEAHRRVSRPSLVHKGIVSACSEEQIDDIRVERDAMARTLGVTKAREAELERQVAEVSTRLQQLNHEVWNSQVQVDDLRAQLEREKGVAVQERIEHGRVLQEFAQELTKAQYVEESLRDEIETLRDRAQALRKRNASLESRVEALETSTSLRWGRVLTAPGRFVKARLRHR